MQLSDAKIRASEIPSDLPSKFSTCPALLDLCYPPGIPTIFLSPRWLLLYLNKVYCGTIELLEHDPDSRPLWIHITESTQHRI